MVTEWQISYKQLNGQYGTFYRKRVKGKGYVFQNRFKSTLTQDSTYLQMAIAYNQGQVLHCSIQ